MAEALTYSSLLSDVEAYAERHDAEFLAQIPRIVMLAENKLAAEIKGLGFLKVVTFDLTISNPVYAKPARWRETASLSIVSSSQRSFLKQRGLEYIQTYWPNQSTVGTPEFYADYDYEHWLFAPTPDATYSATLNYYERPEPLDATNQTNWTTRYAPQLLLSACLIEAQSFLKTPERLQEFMMMYQSAAVAINKENVSRVVDKTSSRVSK